MYQFDRETLLDLVVNAIPLVIMLFFFLLFIVVNPFQADLVATTLQLSIVGVTFVGLLVLTYYSGKAISEAEEDLESDPEAFAEPQAAAADAELASGVDDEDAFDEETADDPDESGVAVADEEGEVEPAVTAADEQ